MKRKIFSVLFALVLVLSFGLVTAVPVSASPLSITPVTPTDIEVGPAYTDLTGPVIAEGLPGEIGIGEIILTAPTGFTFDTTSPVAATVTAGDLLLDPVEDTQIVMPEESSITIDVLGVSSVVASTISYSGIKIKNTDTAGTTGSLEFSGTAGVTGSAGTLTSVPGPAVSIVISPDAASITAGEGQAYTAEATDAYGNDFDVTGETIFSIDPGAGGGWAANLYTSEKAGLWTVTGAYDGLTDDTFLTVEPGDPVSIVISPDPATIIAGQSQTYTATAYDQFYNEVGYVTGMTTFSIDEPAGGDWTANVYTSEFAGIWTVTGDYGGITDTASLTVEPGAAVSFVFNPMPPVTAGQAFPITITALDQYGNVATGYMGTANLSDLTGTIDPTATTAFTAGVWMGNVTINGAMVDNTITATDTVAPAITGTSTNFDVDPGDPVSIVISPDAATIIAGTDQAYTAEATDAYGNVFDVTTGTTFSIDDGAGGSWGLFPDENIYTSELAGTWTVTGEYETDVTDTAILSVNPGPAASIVIAPDTATITAGDNITYTATAYDEFGNEVGEVTANTTFSIDEPAGGGWADNVYTSEFAGTWMVTGDYDVFTGYAALTVEPGEGTSMVIYPDSLVITAGDHVIYGAWAYDAFGNEFEVTAQTTFSIDLEAGGSWTDNAYTSEVAGPWTVTGAYDGLTGYASLDVEAGEPADIFIFPIAAIITAGDNITYTATAYDQFYNEVGDVTANTTFSIDEPAGGGWADNVYTSEVAGTWEVTGAYDGLTGYASLTVDPGAVETLTIVQQPTDAMAGVVIAPPVTVEAKDGFGNAIAGQDVIASLQVGTGALSGNLTQASDISGIATFNDLSIDLPAAVNVLRFTADGVTRDSSPFIIYPAVHYDQLLTLKDGWSLISTDSEIDTGSSAFIGATLVLKYTDSGFLSANFTDLKPVEALYVKMSNGGGGGGGDIGGWIGLNYLDAVPGVSAKDLVAGWNLISSATAASAAAVLSPLRYVEVGQQQGIGLATVVSQGNYNLSGINYYLATLTDADWESLSMIVLSPFDGYWVYMNAAKIFGVIPAPPGGGPH